MRLYKEQKRLKATQTALRKTNLGFGPNKRQELTRLIYEVSKRDNLSPKAILKGALGDNGFKDAKQTFINLKGYLLKKRFPNTLDKKRGFEFYLPKIDLNNRYRILKKNSVSPVRNNGHLRYPISNGVSFYPKTIFIERDVEGNSLTKSILKRFPRAKRILINRIKDYIKSNQSKSPIGNYNLRAKNLFLIKERYDFIKPCPCSKGVLGCGYYILNLGFGCIYECSYCFLQNYTNTGGIVLPINIEDFLSKLEIFLKGKHCPIRIGTGEFTDSLALDEITGYSKILIDFFSRFENVTLELKTKSINVENILKLNHKKRTVIAWSLNPQSVIDSDEWQTSSLEERLSAARRCCQAGYSVGFHFDPVIYSANWEREYREVVDALFKKINSANIAWISLGTFRFSPRLKTIIEQRFPQSKILDEELMLGFDRKLRYRSKQRIRIYKKMVSWIRSHCRFTLVYLCMEPKEIWREVLGRSRF